MDDSSTIGCNFLLYETFGVITVDIEQLRTQALNQCIDIANEYSEQEIKKFFPREIQIAWEIGNTYLSHALKEAKKKRKGLVL